MTHDVLCVRYRSDIVYTIFQIVYNYYFSPTKSVEKSLVAVGLLDATIKVFFNNSMKFFLSL